MKYVRYYIIVVVIDTLSGWVVYTYFPNYRNYLLLEDSLIENLSAFFFLLTFFVAFFLAIKKKGNNKALFLTSAVGLLGFLDELSYGERLFRLSMPFIDDMKIDALHDIYELAYLQLFKLIPTHAVTVYLLITSAAISFLILLFIYKSKVWRELSMTHTYPPYILMLLIVLFLVSALVIDLEIVVLDPLTMLEEMLEMNVGIGLLFYCFSLCDSGSSQKPTKKTVAAAVVKTVDRLGPPQRWMGVAGAGVVLLVLGILAWHQGWIYEDTETLRRDNVAKSPGSWAFHYVQGNVLSENGELEEAIRHYRQALKLSQGNVAIYFDLGNALVKQGHLDEAVENFRQALKIKPDFAEAYHRLGRVVAAQGDFDQAIEHYRQALRIQPEFTEAHEGLGNALARQGKKDEAVKHYEKALRIMKSRREASAPR